MRHAILCLPLGCLLLPVASAQYRRSDFHHHHFTGALGVAVPGGDLTTFYKDAFAWSFTYGYRPLKYLQADLGYEGAYNAARVRDYIYNPAAGYLRIRDFQVFLPIGGRVVAPLARGRLEFYAGGGAAYLRTAEFLRQPNQWVRFECPDCVARDGWGYYALLGSGLALDSGQHLRLNATTRVYRATTSGPPVGATPAINTNEQWVNTCFGLTFSF